MVKKQPFAAFDLDGTLVRWQLYHAVAEVLFKLGYVSAELYDTVRQARMAWKHRTDSFKDYETILIRTYEKVLTELTLQQFQQAVAAVFEVYKNQVYTYPRQLISKLKQQGYVLLAISGSQLEIVELVAKYWGFNDWSGTVYEYAGGHFTGRKTIGSANKARVLAALTSKHNLGYQGSIALGDSSSDISMLELVKQPIAFNPDKGLFDFAAAAGWKIVIERKDMVYQMEKNYGKYQLVTSV